MTAPLQGAAAISLAVAGGRLTHALSRSDMVEVLVTAAELDRMVRNLGPLAATEEDRAALVRAHDLVLSVLARLESEMEREQSERRRDSRLRLAYAAAPAA